jgi:hypothetical protein
VSSVSSWASTFVPLGLPASLFTTQRPGGPLPVLPNANPAGAADTASPSKANLTGVAGAATLVTTDEDEDGVAAPVETAPRLGVEDADSGAPDVVPLQASARASSESVRRAGVINGSSGQNSRIDA